MRTSGDMPYIIEHVIGLPARSVATYVNCLRQGDKLSRNGRGLAAAEMTAQDAAHILLASTCSKSRDTLACIAQFEAMRRKTETTQWHKTTYPAAIRAEPHFRDMVSQALQHQIIKDLTRRLPKGESIIQAVTNLIADTRSARLARPVKTAEDRDGRVTCSLKILRTMQRGAFVPTGACLAFAIPHLLRVVAHYGAMTHDDPAEMTGTSEHLTQIIMIPGHALQQLAVCL